MADCAAVCGFSVPGSVGSGAGSWVLNPSSRAARPVRVWRVARYSGRQPVCSPFSHFCTRRLVHRFGKPWALPAARSAAANSAWLMRIASRARRSARLGVRGSESSGCVALVVMRWLISGRAGVAGGFVGAGVGPDGAVGDTEGVGDAGAAYAADVEELAHHHPL